MSIWVPWLATFFVCVIVFLIGLRFQKLEREKRKKRDAMRAEAYWSLESATSALHGNPERKKSSGLLQGSDQPGKIFTRVQ